MARARATSAKPAKPAKPPKPVCKPKLKLSTSKKPSVATGSGRRARQASLPEVLAAGKTVSETGVGMVADAADATALVTDASAGAANGCTANSPSADMHVAESTTTSPQSPPACDVAHPPLPPPPLSDDAEPHDGMNVDAAADTSAGGT